MRIYAANLLLHNNPWRIPGDMNVTFDSFSTSNLCFKHVIQPWLKDILRIMDKFIDQESVQSMILDWMHKSVKYDDVDLYFKKLTSFLTSFDNMIQIVMINEMIVELKKTWTLCALFTWNNLSVIDRFKCNILHILHSTNVFWILIHQDPLTNQFNIDNDCLQMIQTYNLELQGKRSEFSFILHRNDKWSHAGHTTIKFEFV